MIRLRSHPFAWIVIFVLAVSAGAFWFLRSPAAAQFACSLARRHLPGLVGLDVAIGRCEILPLEQMVRLHGLSLFEPGSEEPVFAADELEVSLWTVRPVLSRVELRTVRALRPRVYIQPKSTREPASTSDDRCALNLLRRVGARTLDVRDGSIDIRRRDGASIHLRGLELVSKDGNFNLRLQEGKATLPSGVDFPLQLNASGSFESKNLSLKITSASAGSTDVQVRARGGVVGLCDPTFALEADGEAKLIFLRRVLPTDFKPDGRLTAQIKLNGTLHSPVVSASLQGRDVAVSQYKPGNFKAHLTYRRNELQFDNTELQFGPGIASLNGSVALVGNFPAKAHLTVRDAQFGKILDAAGETGPWVDFLATGKADLSGPLLPRPALDGSADIYGSQFAVTARPYDAPPGEGPTLMAFNLGHVVTGVKILHDRVDFVGSRVTSGGSAAGGDVTIFYNPEKGLSVHGYGNPIRLEDVGPIADLPWSGSVSTNFFIGGPFGTIGIDAEVKAQDFVLSDVAFGNAEGKLTLEAKDLSFQSLNVRKGKSSYYGNATLKFGRGPLHLVAQASLPSGRLEDMVDVIAGLSPGIAHFQGETTGRISEGHLTFDCPAKALDGSASFKLSDVRYFGRRIGDGQASVKFIRGQAIRVDDAFLKGPAGDFKLAGIYGFHGNVDMRFGAGDVSAAEWVGSLVPPRLRIDANAVVEGIVTGTGDRPAIDAAAHSSDVAIGKHRLGAMEMRASLRGRELHLSGPMFTGAQTDVSITMAAPFRYRAGVEVDLPEIRPFLAEVLGAEGTSGALKGTISLKGQLSDLGGSTGSALFPLLTVSHGDFSGANDGPIRLVFDDRQVTVENFAFKGPNTQIKLNGAIAPEIDASTQGSLDMRLVESLVPYFERSAGRVEFTAVATGTVDNPRLVGSAEIANARLALKNEPVTIRNLAGRVEFSETRILLQDFRASANDGRMLARGAIALGASGISDVEVELQLEEISARVAEDVPALLSGGLLLHGKPGALVLSGDMDVLRLRYDQPIVLEKTLFRLPSVSVATGERPGSVIGLDVGVHSKSNVRVDNNLGRAKIVGDIRLTGTTAQPGLVGVLQAEPGSQLFFRGNQFGITQASLEFKDRTRIDAFFDVQAQAQVREYLVRLHAFGPVDEPNLILASEPPLPEADVLSLLTLGVTSKDTAVARAGAGLAVEALFNASGLEQQIQRFLPKTQAFRDLSLRLSTGYNELTGLVEPMAQVESRLLTEQLKLRASQPVSGRGRKAQAAYQFNDRLSVEAQWEENSIYSFGNFGLLLRMHLESR